MQLKTNEPLKAREGQVWRYVARFFSVAARLLDEDLQTGANISLSEYAVLVHLSEEATGQLRVRELAESRRPLGKPYDSHHRGPRQRGVSYKESQSGRRKRN